MHADAAVTGISRTPATAARNTIQPLADVVNLTLRSRAGQTANHVEGRNSSGVLQWAMSAAGALTLATIAATGAITGASASLTGALTAASASLSGALSADSGAFASTLTVGGSPVVRTAGLSPNSIPKASAASTLADSALADTGTRLTLTARNVSLNGTAAAAEGMLYRNVPTAVASAVAHQVEAVTDVTSLITFDQTYGLVITPEFSGTSGSGNAGTHTAVRIAPLVRAGTEDLNTLYGLRIQAYPGSWVAAYNAINADGPIVTTGSMVATEFSLTGIWSVNTAGEMQGTALWSNNFDHTLANTSYRTGHVVARVSSSTYKPVIGFNSGGSAGAALYFNGLGDMRIRFSDGTDVGISTTGSGGSISGTTGKLAKFTSATALGDSLVSESGTTVTVAGDLSTTGTMTSTGRATGGDLRVTSFTTQYSIPFTTNTSGDFGASTSLLFNSSTGTLQVEKGSFSSTLATTGLHTASGGTLYDTSQSSAQGKVHYAAVDGLSLRGRAGSTRDFTIYSADAGLLFGNPTGTRNVNLGHSSGTVSVAAILSTSNGIQIEEGGTDTAGRIIRTAASGVVHRGINGTTYAWVLRSHGGSDIMRNAQGTTAMEFVGAVSMATTLSVTGISTLSGRVNIGGAVDDSSFMLNVAGGAIAVRGANSILSYGVGNPGEANYERMSMIHTGSAAELRSQASGTGTVEPLRLVVGSTTRYEITNAGAHAATGTLDVSGLITGTAGATITGGPLILGSNTTTQNLRINGPAATDRQIRFMTAGVNRWLVTADNATESGSGAGTDFVINARDDAGASVDNPFRITRASGGSITLARPTTISGALTLSSSLTFAAGQDILIADNSGAALTFSEGGNAYLRFVTTNGSEAIQAFKNFTLSGNLDLSSTSSTATFRGTVEVGNPPSATASLKLGQLNALPTNVDASWIYSSNTSSGSYPFNAFGHLVLQPRSSSPRDVVFMTCVGASTTPTLAMAIEEAAASRISMARAVTMSSTLSVTGATTGTGGFVSGSDDALIRNSTTGQLALAGGTSSSSGANILLYAGSHATLANDFRIRAGSTNVLFYDHSASEFTISTPSILSVATTGIALDIQNPAGNGGIRVRSGNNEVNDGTEYIIQALNGTSGTRLFSVEAGGLTTVTGNLSVSGTLAAGSVTYSALSVSGAVFLVTSNASQVVIGNSAALKSVRLEVQGGSGVTAGILLSTSASDATNKEGRIKAQHYTNAEEPTTMMWAANLSGSSTLYIGGNSSAENAVTAIDFFTAANTTTTSGTRRGGFSSAGAFDVVGAASVGAVFDIYGVGAAGASNYERLRLQHDGSFGYIQVEAGGTGTQEGLRIQAGGSTRYAIATSGTIHTFTGAASFSSTLAVTSTSTLTGRAGVGTSPDVQVGLNIGYGHGTITGTTQYGILADNQFGSDATSAIHGLYVRAQTQPASYTTTSLYTIRIASPIKGAGHTITTAYGLKVENQSGGSTNYAIHTGTGTVSFGDNMAIEKEIAFAGFGTTGTARVVRTATDGMVIQGVNGSSNAWTLVSHAGTILLRNPQSTNTLTADVALTATGGVVFNGGGTNLNYYLSGSFTVTFTTGFLTGTPTATLYYVRVGNAVICRIAAFSAGNGTGVNPTTSSGSAPAAIRPGSTAVYCVLEIIAGGVAELGKIKINTDGTISLERTNGFSMPVGSTGINVESGFAYTV